MLLDAECDLEVLGQVLQETEYCKRFIAVRTETELKKKGFLK